MSPLRGTQGAFGQTLDLGERGVHVRDVDAVDEVAGAGHREHLRQPFA